MSEEMSRTLRRTGRGDCGNVDILIECRTCAHSWDKTFRQPVKSIGAQQCEACEAWEEVLKVAHQLSQHNQANHQHRDKDLSGRLVVEVVNYCKAVPSEEADDE